MRTIRLLPIVVVAASSLLAFKALGLATGTGYLLPGFGVTETVAEDAAPATGTQIETTPDEITLADPSPTLADTNTTLETAPAADDYGAAEAGETHAATPAAEDEPDPGYGEDSQAADSYGDEAAADDCAFPESPAPVPGEPEAEISGSGVLAPDCVLENAVATELDANGIPVPLSTDAGVLTERALLERLTERRGELDAYAAELELRAALIEAAEKRVEERAATMAALEAQIAGLVEQRAAAETDLMTGVVAMYETMRPGDAAAIFNDLDMAVLLQLARTMPPRKMAPILAEMNPLRAQDLTVRLATIGATPGNAPATADISELPQIVGQ